tara:strand:- start:1807 stop:2352 length:546 start_codon:yes stop_codon:yes gene_type:complete
MGVIVAWKGCGDTSGKPVTTIIEKPIPTIEYVDRWRTDTVRFVSKEFVTVRDTITSEIIINRLDTLFLVDTVSIVEAWLTEIAKYDTTIDHNSATVSLSWQNYQNRTENLMVTYTPKKAPLKWALGVHGNAGLLSNFKDSYVPLMGVGLQATVKRGYYGIDYGFNGNHYIGVRVGRNVISR